MKAALITGASSGIGAEFARQLAARKSNLVLVARSEDKLIQLANELGRTHQITAQHVAIDLTSPDAARRLFEETQQRGLEIDLLINNAGFGSMGEFLQFDAARDREMIELNINSLVELTHYFLPPMRERKHGAILNVASTAAFQPVPYMATYAATKAFVLSFSEALWAENREHGVTVTALCPGVTDTNFFAAAEGKRPPLRIMETPEAVVATALRALDRRKSHVISGWLNFFVRQSERLLPHSLIALIGAGAMKEYSKHRTQK